MYDIVIIGAGVSGCAIARELSRYKADILVVEREEDVCCGTSKANSAIVHAGFDAAHGTLMAKLNVEGSRMMPALAKELDFHYKQNGSLVVCMSEEDRPALNKLYENGVANGVEGLRIVEKDELQKMEPNISDNAVAALYAPTGGIVCPFGLTFAFAENAAKNGAKFQFDTEVLEVAPMDGGWKLHTSKGDIETRVVVNAAGLYSDKFHNQAGGAPMKIIPRRGDYFLLDRTTGGFVKNTIFQLPGKYGKGVLVSPTVHGNTIVGPTAIDIEDKEATATTQAGLDEVREKSGIAVKNLPLRQVITSFAGLRAHEARHEFIIGEAEGAENFIDCAGIESPGLSAAPAIGAFLAESAAYLVSAPINKKYDSTRPEVYRPNEMTIEERAAFVAEHPLYGNIVCRCEQVTEGEIVDAIHRVPGARSLDGVKRRTRAGMGRCQAGFCSPRVLEILSRELGVPQEQLTKSGGASFPIVGKTRKDGKNV